MLTKPGLSKETPSNLPIERLVRIKNGVKGYFRRLNHKCATNYRPLYKLIELIYVEVLLVDTT